MFYLEITVVALLIKRRLHVTGRSRFADRSEKQPKTPPGQDSGSSLFFTQVMIKRPKRRNYVTG